MVEQPVLDYLKSGELKNFENVEKCLYWQYLCHHAVDDLRRDLARVLRRLHQLVLGFLQKVRQYISKLIIGIVSKEKSSYFVDVRQGTRPAAFRRAAAAAVRERPGPAAHRVGVPRLELVRQVGDLGWKFKIISSSDMHCMRLKFS